MDSFWIGHDAEQWDLAVRRVLYFVNILINILSYSLCIGPNHRGRQMQGNNERTSFHKSTRSSSQHVDSLESKKLNTVVTRRRYEREGIDSLPPF